MENNVVEFLDKCSKEVGKFTEADFNQDCFNYCYDREVSSPIEQILYCALKTVQKLNYWFLPEAEPTEEVFENGEHFIYGLDIVSQYKVSNYRVDFLISFGRNIQEYKKVIVECDSQRFHERDEKERQYEKKRDRFLQSKGYKVFRYTGSEICKNALNIAVEIMSFIINRDINLQTNSNVGD